MTSVRFPWHGVNSILSKFHYTWKRSREKNLLHVCVVAVCVCVCVLFNLRNHGQGIRLTLTVCSLTDDVLYFIAPCFVQV